MPRKKASAGAGAGATAAAASAATVAVATATAATDASGAGRVVVLDCGGGHITYGFADEEQPRGRMINAMARVKNQLQPLLGDEINCVTNTSLLVFARPANRGYITNWPLQMELWKRVFRVHLGIEHTEECHLVLTLPPFTPRELYMQMCEVVFEEFAFRSLCCRPAASFAAYEFLQTGTDVFGAEAPECVTVVDSGFSFQHVFPFINQTCFRDAVCRVDVGGKVLTNYLKEIISFRQLHMMEETVLMNGAKEALSFVSLDFDADLRSTHITRGDHRHRREYVLPDHQHIMHAYVKPLPKAVSGRTEGDEEAEQGEDGEEGDRDGDERERGRKPGRTEEEYARREALQELAGSEGQEQREQQSAEHEQTLVMENERFTLPEILFRPSDIGIRQAGIAEATAQAITTCPEAMQPHAARHLLVVGGNSNIPNFVDRLQTELRALLPSALEFSTVCHPAANGNTAETWSWKGAARFARDCTHYAAVPGETFRAAPDAPPSGKRSKRSSSSTVGAEEPPDEGNGVPPIFTLQEYLELGADACRERLDTW